MDPKTLLTIALTIASDLDLEREPKVRSWRLGVGGCYIM